MPLDEGNARGRSSTVAFVSRLCNFGFCALPSLQEPLKTREGSILIQRRLAEPRYSPRLNRLLLGCLQIADQHDGTAALGLDCLHDFESGGTIRVEKPIDEHEVELALTKF